MRNKRHSKLIEIIRANFNIKLNKSAKMKIKSSIIQQDLIISLRLLMIFTFIVLINSSPQNLWLAKIKGKEVDN